jgi:copper(I)-binding protein
LPLPGAASFKQKEIRLLRRSVFFVTCLLIANSAVGQTGQLEIKAPWARATPGQAQNGAAYLTIVSPTTDRLTAVSSSVAKKAELHTMTTEGGVMRMRPLTAIDIPAGQTVTLSPGGTHIMLLGLTQPLREGQSFPLTLSFDHAGQREVTVVIEKAGAMGPAGQATGSPPMHMHH